MLTRSHSWPTGHWDWPIHVSHKHGLRCGEMILLGGQVDLDSSGNVLHPDDLAAQTAAVMDNIAKVLKEFGADLGDVVKLIAYYQNDGGRDENAFLADVARHFSVVPGPVITAVPLPALAYPGMIVEIEAVAMLGTDGRKLKRTTANVPDLAPLPKPLCHGLRCGQMIFVGGQSAVDSAGKALAPGDIVEQSRMVMDRIGQLLGAFGARHDDCVKFNIYYTGQGRFEDWQGAAKARAAYFTEPGPAATGVPLPRHADPAVMTRNEVIAMLGEDGRSLPRRHVWPRDHWDWPIHLPYKHGIKCGNMIFLGGQVALTPKGEVMKPGDLVEQTKIAMEYIRRVLDGFGAGFDDTVKVTAFYEGGASAEQLHRNLKIRSGCFTEPGPASTGIPVPFLAYRQMVIEIEIVAMAV